MVLKSRTAHLFHAGDARNYRLEDPHLEHLTRDHRLRMPGAAATLTPTFNVAMAPAVTSTAVRLNGWNP